MGGTETFSCVLTTDEPTEALTDASVLLYPIGRWSRVKWMPCHVVLWQRDERLRMVSWLEGWEDWRIDFSAVGCHWLLSSETSCVFPPLIFNLELPPSCNQSNPFFPFYTANLPLTFTCRFNSTKCWRFISFQKTKTKVEAATFFHWRVCVCVCWHLGRE